MPCHGGRPDRTGNSHVLMDLLCPAVQVLGQWRQTARPAGRLGFVPRNTSWSCRLLLAARMYCSLWLIRDGICRRLCWRYTPQLSMPSCSSTTVSALRWPGRSSLGVHERSQPRSVNTIAKYRLALRCLVGFAAADNKLESWMPVGQPWRVADCRGR